MRARLRAVAALGAGLALVSACGGAAGARSPAAAAGPVGGTESPAAGTEAAATAEGKGELTEWPEFGLDPQRSDATNRPTGITAANVGRLVRHTIQLPGTVDSSPIYVHAVRVRGGHRDMIVVTTSYGRTVAIDASDGRLLWTFTPPGYPGWAGGAQITNTSPLADPDRKFVYAASPNGLVYKLSLANGQRDRSGVWPARVTLEPLREKLGSALNLDGPDLIVTTGGYLGDAPAYQGHVALISRASGRVKAVFNTLCANLRAITVPASCPQSDSAILSRGGAVVASGGKSLLVDTGNGPWNGTTDFGDSVLELSFPGLQLRQAFTPADQETLAHDDLDLGSSAPALLGQNRVLVAGKDTILRVLNARRLDGHSSSPENLGGELQTLHTPGSGELFTAPAVWHHGGRTTVFVADFHATAAYDLSAGHLRLVWENGKPGTSPILAGGLLYVYEPQSGGIEVYKPTSPHPIAHLAGAPGHWNSPIVVDGHVVEPEGDANNHLQTGTLDLFSMR
jgi:hypothetical protein